MGARTGDVVGLADGTRLVVTAGNPTPEEAAALVVALDAALGAERAARRSPPALPPWQRAAYLEGVGGASVASPAHLLQR